MPGNKKRACKFAVSTNPGVVLLGTEIYLKKMENLYNTLSNSRAIPKPAS